MTLDLQLTHLYRPATPGYESPWLLVLLHGVGSNEADLYSLAPVVPDRFHLLSLRAPYPMGPEAFGWFTFRVHPDGRRDVDTGQEAVSRPLLAEVIESAAAQLSIPAERVVVGGFSQGGIMSLSLLLTRPDLMSAAMVMHSRLLPEVVALTAPAESLQGHRLWVSHGTQDPVIPVANAREIRDRVENLPIELNYAEFPGGHEIRPAELAAAMAWLDGLAGS